MSLPAPLLFGVHDAKPLFLQHPAQLIHLARIIRPRCGRPDGPELGQAAPVGLQQCCFRARCRPYLPRVHRTGDRREVLFANPTTQLRKVGAGRIP